MKNHISIGIEDRVIRVESQENVQDYQDLLAEFYPDSKDEIAEIISQIRKIMYYMEVQYGIDNPIFLDFKKDQAYMLKVLLPWVVKYAMTVSKITALNEPVENFLRRFTRNQSLLDIIAQHFFRSTPAFFALSYLKIFLDYYYPRGGTGEFVKKVVSFIEDHQGTICTNMDVVAIDPDKQQITDAQGNTIEYKRLIWAADQKALYRSIDLDKVVDARQKRAIAERRDLLADKRGNDSVFTVYLAVDMDKSYFANIASEHFFYTPSRTGETAAGPVPIHGDRAAIEQWLEKFFAATTYEISCPVLRDSTLAPQGKTGLVVSVLFDYDLTQAIEAMGWYPDFKGFAETCIINTLDGTIYPGIKDAILQKFSSTPVTFAKVFGNTDGAITGWGFRNQPMPAENRLPKILNAIKTPISGVVQAGQWTYSPSGLPISILTGKMAADQVIQELKKA
ncbi:MAG: NAD(P)/FAD-dependent oxidoreductase [Anaerolineae bacterium]|nr:NAD(P)/FAD-dependent oxidoreductase [Anaerolineae bacterium]